MDIFDFLFPKFCLECKKPGKYLCGDCLKKVRRSSRPDSIWKYEGVVRRAILALKYKFASDIASELAGICADKLKFRNFPANTLLVPIPLHKKRESWRGFNQAEVVGKLLAEKLSWEFAPGLLIRARHTPPQVGLKSSQRRQNIKDVFAVNPKNELPLGSRLLIFDDVYTTGSTLNEAKKALKSAGFKSVRCLTIAG